MLILTGCSQQAASNSSGTTHQTVPGQLTYVAIGASDTFGTGTDDPYTQNWPSDLATKLGPRVHLINLGIPGIVVHDALNVEVPVALDAHPDLITVWLAVNDIVANVPTSSYSQDLDLLISRLQAGMPHAIIAVANVPDLTLLPQFSKRDPHALDVRIADYNAIIADIVKRHHVILVDLTQQTYNLKKHPEYISNDGLHPNELGYLQLADLFYQALQSSLRTGNRSG